MRAVLFDLDGTLLNTLDDLADAVNFALAELGLPPRSLDEVRRFVGDGAQKLIERALPADRQALTLDGLALFKARYGGHRDDKTSAYPGVLPLLDGLRAREIGCAVVSNKPDEAVGPLCAKYFGDRLDFCMGERLGIPRKPAPDGCLLALRALRVSADEALYVGDSPVDVLTAHSVGLRCAAVTWGFRTRAELEAAGADWVVDDADQLIRLIV